ncbi:MAG TPA: alpha/beta hydrolase [Acidimicrobiales bacterium]|nr:alpha/beta hydrolase [Acidimicrobiales bacterium]
MAVLHTHAFGSPDGAPLLCVHGISGHGGRFRRAAETGWPDRRTLAVDLRGHGRSTSDGPWSVERHVADLVDTLDHAGVLDPVDVVGHSFGGLLALHLLAAAPERVRRIVLLDPAVARPGGFGAERASSVVADVGFASRDEADAWRRRGLAEHLDADVVDAVVAEELDQHLVGDDDGRYRFRWFAPAVVTAWGEVCRGVPEMPVRRPTRLVIASRGGMVTPEVVVALRDRLGEQLSVVEIDAGHLLFWDAHDEMVASVTSALG